MAARLFGAIINPRPFRSGANEIIGHHFDYSLRDIWLNARHQVELAERGGLINSYSKVDGSSSTETGRNDDEEEEEEETPLILLYLVNFFDSNCEVKDTQRWTVEENGFQ